MRLNLPFRIDHASVLIAGAGGGWDVFGGLPIAHELGATNKVVLANYSSSLEGFDVRAVTRGGHPEGTLAGLLKKRVYVFGKGGVEPLKRGYRAVVERECIDAIILVDGGVDSLMRGDEEKPGSILQDTISLCAVAGVDFRTKILACIGFGTETDDGLCHYRALENMATLVRDGHFLGSCALTRDMEAFKFYKCICQKALTKSKGRTDVHTRVIPAVCGQFGRCECFSDLGPRSRLDSERPLFLNPLMALYWFFDLEAVAGTNPLVERIGWTRTYDGVRSKYDALRSSLGEKLRAERDIPL